jgi:hypothetical protein
MRWCAPRAGTGVVSLLSLMACADPPTGVELQPGPPTSVALQVWQSTTVTGDGGVTFAEPGRYAVLAQFAATKDFATPSDTRATVASVSYVIGGATPVAASVASSGGGMGAPASDGVAAFHATLRAMEQQIEPAPEVRGTPDAAGARLNVRSLAAPEVRSFRVLAAIEGATQTFTTVRARLMFEGSGILVYADTASFLSNGFSDEEFAAFGRQFDRDLFPLDLAAFGAPSDQDLNGRAIVLFTPVVNVLRVPGATCGAYVSGFFNSADLNGSLDGNAAEVVYLAVPGAPTGGPSCAPLSRDAARTAIPATFVHEVQHLISYNQHRLLRRGPAEATWLNEGLSHYAEELGGNLYERRAPCPLGPPCPPQGRSSTFQVFPDSAQGFLLPNLQNAFGFFSTRRLYSLTSPTGFGALQERGAAWLFVRWLLDQRGEAAAAQLVQTTRTGTENVSALLGQPFAQLFADYLTAVLLDDFTGAPQGQFPARLQLPSRNLRTTYAQLNATQPTSFPRVYPLATEGVFSDSRLTAASALQSRQMKPGGFDFVVFTARAAGDGLVFRAPTGRFDGELGAQLTVVRLQ